MSNPAAPKVSEESEPPEGTTGPEVSDQVNPFGPDSPHFREDDPKGDLDSILAPPPTPPVDALSEDDFAPDEG